MKTTPTQDDARLLSDHSLSAELIQLAENWAEVQPLAMKARGSKSSSFKILLVERLDAQEALLRRAYTHFSEAVEGNLAPSYAAEWVLDNYYLLQQSVRQVREDTPKTFYRQLPHLAAENPGAEAAELAGYPRIFGLALAIIGECNSRLELGRVTQLIEAYQRVAPLTMGELWALPTMLRLGIVDALVQALNRLIESDKDELGQAGEPPHPTHGGSDDGVVENCVTSLRALKAQDWKVFFERVSLVDKTLRRDPAGVYPEMDFTTRDRYRKAVEALAAKTASHDEEAVARAAVALADEAQPGASQRCRHVGYYLISGGRGGLERRLNYHLSPVQRLRRTAFNHADTFYLGGIALISLLVVLAFGRYAALSSGNVFQILLAALVMLVPALTVSVSLVNLLLSYVVAPRVLPKLDFSEGVSASCRTLVVIPALLSSHEEVESLLAQLERHSLSSADAQLGFALLSDFVDARAAQLPEDESLLEAAMSGIEALNAQYGDKDWQPFYLFHRERQWNPREGVWMGWERKRGKLSEFNRLLRSDTATSYSTQVGDLLVLPEVRYVITLDADTQLPRGSAQRLIATLAHPLNQAEFAADSNRVINGYSLLQPRTEILPESANRSRYTRLFAGESGLDLYTLAVSDIYQDLFAEGIYVGKGIYEVDAFERSLEGRVPENSLLSHDLFEGLHARAGLVSDVLLFEEYPPNYLAQVLRSQRWLRGDWQLLPWLLGSVPHAGEGKRPNDLATIQRWKLLDNLRRSLLAPALLALFLLGWLGLPGSPLIWTLTGLLTLAVPLLSGVVTGVVRSVGDEDWAHNARGPLRDASLRWLLSLSFIPFEALLALRSIGTTLVRLKTRRHLLQWTTAAQTARRVLRPDSPWDMVRQLTLGLSFTFAITVLVAIIEANALFVAAPLLLAWFLAPWLAYDISRPLASDTSALTGDQRQQVRLLARRTWLYFERFVGPEDHWLPPDNVQETPDALIAHRTSPTNIGLLLLSTLAAYDLGYIGLVDLSLRLRQTFQTLEKLERYRGHLLNWYETRSLASLPPRYVSAVDSGNLAACLMSLKAGCSELLQSDVLHPQRWHGLLDTLAVLAESLIELEGAEADALRKHVVQLRGRVEVGRSDPVQWAELLDYLFMEGWATLETRLIALSDSDPKLSAATLRELRIWSERVHYNLRVTQRELDLLSPWLSALADPPALVKGFEPTSLPFKAFAALEATFTPAPKLADLAAVCELGSTLLTRLRESLEQLAASPARDEALAWCETFAKRLTNAADAARGLLDRFGQVRTQAETFFVEMDFTFLFDAQRQLFHIGYNVDSETLDANYYDLLASEARLASLIAIAKNEVPQSHWLHLGRSLADIEGRRTLLSWSGTMFEYLMPELLTKRFGETLLTQSCRTAVDCQIAYAQQRGVPWGISESGYNRVDASGSYQYQAFGVPDLGLKRGLGNDLVIAPYASMLALAERPQAVMHNLEPLKNAGALSTYGFHEAIDYTPARLPLGQSHVVLRSYMAHHQGMALLSFVNALEQNVMVHRFHADPRIKSVELLLQERIPRQVPLAARPEEAERGRPASAAQRSADPWRVPVEAPLPYCHYLSNGRYGVLITAAGGGYSTWGETALTRWRADTTLDDWGTWLYLQDEDSGALWSATRQPLNNPATSQEVLFYPHKAEFQRLNHDIYVTLELSVAPDDDIELRRVTLTNRSDRTRKLRLTSYAEVVLAPQEADRRHQAFNKLFIESSFESEQNALLFRRRPRSADETPLFMGHSLLAPNAAEPTQYESDRARFLGRGHTVRTPQALAPDGTLSGTTGATLDPMMALAQTVILEPHASTQLFFLTTAADTRGETLALLERYRNPDTIHRAFEQVRAQCELELRQFELDTADLEAFQGLLSALVYPTPALRAKPDVLAANTQGQSSLWGYAISGDLPILLLRVGSQEDTALLRELLRAHAYWRRRGLSIDLVVLNTKESGYNQEVQGQLRWLLSRSGDDAWLNKRGGIFLLRADQLPEADRVLLESAARVILDGDGGTLQEQLSSLRRVTTYLPAFEPVRPANTVTGIETTEPLPRPENLQFDNGLGGFSPDGKEYLVYLEPGVWTPAPWCNVIANPEFGFLTSEAGLGASWAVNSGENRLTPWRNDPVSDPPGEALYLRDEETAEVWSPTPLPCRSEQPYLIRHGAGTTVYEHHSHGLKQSLRVFALPDAPVKLVALKLTNTYQRPRRVTATYYAPWILGTDHDTTQMFVLPEYSAEHCTLLARNPYNTEFAGQVAFLASNKSPHGVTTDRSEFLGRMGSLTQPAALERIGLSSTVRAGLDPCAVIQLHLDLPPGGSEEVVFVLGQAADKDEALHLANIHRNLDRVESSWQQVSDFWDDLLGTVQVETPDAAMNLLLNRWLLYQDLACRIWGRSGFYQSSGAYGFRDQLQDVMALLHARPEVARAQILRAARHQFEPGDVLHWWHPPSGRGVRTRITDDLLWLPFVTAEYIATTGDAAVLEEKVPFLTGEPLKKEEEERYGHYDATEESFSLLEHCHRALKKGATQGKHGLPLMGGGDWNDGMNRVGVHGEGESVWLGWFLHLTLTRFAALCEQLGDNEGAAGYLEQAENYQQALEQSAWDGAWYLRAFYDDGTPLGSQQNRECQIDAIAQSWSIISGAGSPERAEQALASVNEKLVRDEDGLILLFTPPFDKTTRDPGYIKGYLPGIRENGGQYTHAALWTVWAFAELGQGDRAEELFRLINPVYHADTPVKRDLYRVEPYVVVADIYGVAPHAGRGGWTWYTGSGGWMYRLGLEAILGLRRRGERLVLEPCIPKIWSEYRLTYRDGDTNYHIRIDNTAGVNRGVRRVTLDGAEQVDGIPLLKDGQEHEVEVVLGDSSQ